MRAADPVLWQWMRQSFTLPSILPGSPEDTDYSELTLDLVDFSPGADWVGGSYDTVTIPVAEGVLLSGSPVSVDNREKDLYSFLSWPLLRSYALPGSADVLRVEVRDGALPPWTGMRG